jgi:prephenate dehydrogenase
MVPPLIPSITSITTTCIVGGGNSAHILIPFLSEAGHRVNILTRRPDDWQTTVYCQITDGMTGEITHTHAGCLDKKSTDPAEVIPDADIIILCMPVHQYRPALDRLAPFINRKKEVFVGTVSMIDTSILYSRGQDDEA